MFFGTSEFAVPSLRALHETADVILVVTQPDRPAGRGQQMHMTPVKAVALELGIQTFEPHQLRDAGDRLRSARPDIFVVASYGKIVPQAILDIPRVASFNVHPSMLPLYRGATPLQSQLRDGVVHSGVSIILMDAGMDTGDVVLQEPAEIGLKETFGELHDRFAAIGARLLSEVVRGVAIGALHRTPQSTLGSWREIDATLTRPLSKADLYLDGVESAKAFLNAVRAYDPTPLARLHLFGNDVKIVAARIGTDEERAAAGGWMTAGWFVPEGMPEVVFSGRLDGLIVVTSVIPPSRGPMSAGAYARSVRGSVPQQ